ncbi:MAG: hypothetical protein HY707_03535 [Ignavibacteriae bacterium]|nr:hypothetical protein [Ignavibacteriota bacterium]
MKFVQLARISNDNKEGLKGAAHVAAQQFSEKKDLVVTAIGKEEYRM